MRIEKGSPGYVRDQQRVRTIRTILLFCVVAAVFAVGMILNKGDRRNIYSIVAAVGCIPAAMSAVSMVLMWMQKPVDASLAKEVEAKAGHVKLLYELYVTTAEHNLYLKAAAAGVERIAALAEKPRKEGDLQAVLTHLRNALADSCGYVEIEITTDKEVFLELLSDMEQEYTEYCEDPDMQDKTEHMAQILLALSL